MERPAIPIKAYRVVFAIDTINTEEIVKAYDKASAEGILNKRYANCKILIWDIIEIWVDDSDKRVFNYIAITCVIFGTVLSFIFISIAYESMKYEQHGINWTFACIVWGITIWAWYRFIDRRLWK